ncbi:MAG: hypothetical protein MJ141_01760 [Clostridia bacterium]|nr:hypothetical protein [Clostridia bacterium]
MKPTTIVTRYRILALVGVLLAILFSILLFRMQLSADAEAAEEDPFASIATTNYITTIPAVRGEILDRNGQPLVSNKQVYAIRFNRSGWNSSTQNDVILSLIALLKSHGIAHTDSLPISNAPYAYTISYGSTLSTRKTFDRYLEDNEWSPEDKATDIVALMCEKYGIGSEYSDTDKRLILGVRYEMDSIGFSVLVPYTFATDVGMDVITAIKEKSYFYDGVEIVSSTSRVYEIDYAAHILGRVGKIYKEEYEVLASQGYGMNDIVGKDGAEKAFESYLRGVDGYQKLRVDSYQNVVEVLSDRAAEAGNNVILTIDSKLQKVTEDALANRIEEIKRLSEIDPDTYPADVGGGAAIMMKVDTAEVLSMASYPTYNLKTFSEDYNTLLENELTPMVNRVIGGAYPIGSVFKMVTAVAGLEEGVITPHTIINDLGRYTKYKTFQPQCWIYRQHHATHGPINVSMALRDSCNYFFYSVADELGIDTLDKWAQLFGLGIKTGIELPGEIVGQRANAASKAKVDRTAWSPGDTLTAAIGQSYSLFSPIQVCAYLSAVCNGGYYYRPHILKEVTTYDYSSVVVSVQPELVNTISMSQNTYAAVMEGMLDAAENGTAAKVFENYPMRVGGKTGSSQVASGTSHGVFAAFAPFDDPEVAVFVIVEHGGSGGNIGIIAREMFDAYFDLSTDTQKSSGLNSLGS